jgi:hypothetical protein
MALISVRFIYPSNFLLSSAHKTTAEEKDRMKENRERQSSAYATVPVGRQLFASGARIVVLTRLQSADPSPQLPRRSSRKQKQSQYQDESELSLLAPNRQRNDSEASGASTARQDSQSRTTGIGIRYDETQSPPPRAYSIGSLGFQGQGTFGWPSGYSTGVDEENAMSPVAKH